MSMSNSSEPVEPRNNETSHRPFLKISQVKAVALPLPTEADKLVEAAETSVEKAEAAARAARVERDEANGNRIARLCVLGDLLDQWQKEFGPHKHRGADTFFAKAVKACGNDDVYYRARDIRGPHGYPTEQAALVHAGPGRDPLLYYANETGLRSWLAARPSDYRLREGPPQQPSLAGRQETEGLQRGR